MAKRIPKAVYPALGLIAVFTGVGVWADGLWFLSFLAVPAVFGLAAWALMRRRGPREALSAGIWTAAAALAGSAVRQIGFWVTAALVVVAFTLRWQFERNS